MDVEQDRQPWAMLVNVGGAVPAIVHTLNERQPPFILFFVSEGSQKQIREQILPALSYTPEHYDWIRTTSAQDLLACYRSLADGVPPILEKWGVPPEALAVEYTSGTKPMSVAAVLATIDFSSQYLYVGSKDAAGRDKGGMGVVLDGREFTWFQTNPWEQLSIRTRREIALLFNYGRFADAQERAQRLAPVAPNGMQKVYAALAELIEGYALWDRFEYRQAKNKIYKAVVALQLHIAGRDDPLKTTLEQAEKHAVFLDNLTKKDPEARRLDILDLLANAGRRAAVAKKYDDAVARLYAALESIARYRLQDGYGIKSGSVRPEQVPESCRAEYIHRYGDPDRPDQGLRLGLQAQYLLLEALGDPLGQAYVLRESELNEVLLARNQSRLAHGSEPVRPDVYEKLSQICLDFAGVTPGDLPEFPEMRL